LQIILEVVFAVRESHFVYC